MNDNLRLVIVGHVDHGKSTLIGRLLHDTNSLPEGKMEEIQKVCEILGKEFEFGFILDNLDEERTQGITIDTAQIWFRTPEREYNIIDAPGHVEFVKNMITGASQAEAAILIVDANEGVQEQTRRHAYILGMLGLKQVIVVMNKMDLVGHKKEKFDEVLAELNKFLRDVKINPSYIIPISAAKGDNIATKSTNMDWYKGPTVVEALAKFKPHESNEKKPMRFVVQDVYKWDKRIVAGRVESGTLKKGDEIVILPSEERTVVESVEEFLKDVTEATVGKSAGIVTKDKVFVDRGDVISDPNNKPRIKTKVKAHVFWMSKDSMEDGERIIIKLATQQCICKVKLEKVINSSTLEIVKDTKILRNREVADVLLEFEKPMVVENFNDMEELGRFVLERLNTCAGGIITDTEL
ncbi:MAG: GTP-binding protein [Candidatus Aenigmatarchaeota archaeon]